MAASDTDPVARLRDLLAGTANPKPLSQSKSKSKTKRRGYNIDPARRSNRLMTGIGLRAAARKAAGKELSPFEEQTLSMFKVWADDKVIAALGHEFVQHKRSRGAGGSLLPEAVLQLHDDEPYTREHFLRDVRKLAPEIVAQPENQIVNLESIMDGNVDSKEYKAALAKMGNGVTLFSSRPVTANSSAWAKVEAQNGSGSESASVETIKVKEEKDKSTIQRSAKGARSGITVPIELVLSRMYCKTAQEGEHRTDEIYVAYGAGSDGAVLSNNKTREYEYIVDDTWTNFDPGTKLYSGTFDLTFNAHMEVWESDHTNDAEYDRMIETLHEIASNLRDAAIEGMESEEANEGAAVVALLSIILDLVAAILDIFRNQDDCLCTRTLAFDRAGIAAICDAKNQELGLFFQGSYDDSNDWTGEHTVYIRSTKPRPPCGAIVTTGIELAGDEFQVSANKSVYVNSKFGIGLTCFKDQVVGVYGRETEGVGMWISAPVSTNPTSWSSPVQFCEDKIRSRPALAVIGTKLHVCFRPMDGLVRWYWTEDLKHWSQQVWLNNMPDYDSTEPQTDCSVTTASFQNQMFVMIRNIYGYLLFLKQDPNSNQPAEWKRTVWRSDYAPGLVVFEDSLYCFFVNYDNQIGIRKYNSASNEWQMTKLAPFSSEVYSSFSCVAIKSIVVITYRNIHGTPMVGTLSGLTSGSQPVWKSKVLNTEGVGDPEICTVHGHADSILMGWAQAYYNT